MVQVYFYCLNSEGMLIDYNGVVVFNFSEVCDCVVQIMCVMILMFSSEDWCDWVIYVSDDDGEEIFDFFFIVMFGKLY